MLLGNADIAGMAGIAGIVGIAGIAGIAGSNLGKILGLSDDNPVGTVSGMPTDTPAGTLVLGMLLDVPIDTSGLFISTPLAACPDMP